MPDTLISKISSNLYNSKFNWAEVNLFDVLCMNETGPQSDNLYFALYTVISNVIKFTNLRLNFSLLS